ncbi:MULTISPECIES: HalOD1 output domain-containing protein [Haloarcula]|uniref:HalOD1 output domain-containing protein n=1 Tax=Haloarcula TaxID=2237 RepID=UPI0023E8DEDD|nr:HalOD1 output domain-containing protein [Halomicroarcula sp. SHR3]
MNDKATVSTEVVRAVARVEGVDPAAVEPALFEAVDGAALDRLFRETTGHVTFEYDGYEVTVTSEGEVSLAPLCE